IDLLALDRERIEQDPNLSLLRTGDAPELLDVLLAIEIDHDSFRSRCRIRNKSFSLDRDRRQRSPVEKRAAFDEECQLTLREPYDLAVVTPQLCEAAALEALHEDA